MVEVVLVLIDSRETSGLVVTRVAMLTSSSLSHAIGHFGHWHKHVH